MSLVRESKLEQFMKKFVLQKTGETVELFLRDNIIIRHVTKKGSILLASFWANVLQHTDNFPVEKFTYIKLNDKLVREEKLAMSAEGITFAIFMKTGALMLHGEFVYEWFTRRFGDVLDNFDVEFRKTFAFNPTIAPYQEAICEPDVLGDPYTATENYLLMLTPETRIDNKLELFLDDPNALIPGIGNIALDQVLFEGEALQVELDSLQQGAVKDGLSYTHKLWKSVLKYWFSTPGCGVFLASPYLDADRLSEVTDIFMKNHTEGDLKAFYTHFRCDSIGDQNANDIKRAVLKRYSDAKVKTWVEYKVLQKVTYPTKLFHAKFVAGVKDGEAEVLVTSANFHSNSFLQENYETVVYLKMSEEDFNDKYLGPICKPIVASTYETP